MLVIWVVRIITGISSPLAPALRTASRIAPTAPTDAASVGVAMPARMEPRTARMSANGATRTAISRAAKRDAVQRMRIGGDRRRFFWSHDRDPDHIKHIERDQDEARARLRRQINPRP